MQIKNVSPAESALASSVNVRTPAPQRNTVRSDGASETQESSAPPTSNEEQVLRPATENLIKGGFPSADRSRIRLDEATKRPVIQVVDENNEVIRQLPPEKVLKIAAQFRELQGLLFDEKT